MAFLLVLSCIALSCNTLTQPTVLNIRSPWRNTNNSSKPKPKANLIECTSNALSSTKKDKYKNKKRSATWGQKNTIDPSPMPSKIEENECITWQTYCGPCILKDLIQNDGTIESIQYGTALGINPNDSCHGVKANEYGNAFRHTTLHNRKNIAQYLIKYNLINWNQQDEYGQTALMYVARIQYPGWSKILSTLLKKVDITVTDYDGWNVLMHLFKRWAYIYDHIACYGTTFQPLCNDKKEMLQYLCAHKDIANIINYPGIQGSITNLLNKIDKIDQNEAEEIYNILTDAGLIM